MKIINEYYEVERLRDKGTKFEKWGVVGVSDKELNNGNFTTKFKSKKYAYNLLRDYKKELPNFEHRLVRVVREEI